MDVLARGGEQAGCIRLLNWESVCITRNGIHIWNRTTVHMAGSLTKHSHRQRVKKALNVDQAVDQEESKQRCCLGHDQLVFRFTGSIYLVL